MKIMLHKPQREAANAVLAYDYEPPDIQDQDGDVDSTPRWVSHWSTDAYCHDNSDCWHEHGAGDCTLESDGTDQWCW